MSPAANGYARAWPAGTSEPNATFLNYSAGESIGNTGTIPIASTTSTADMTVRAHHARARGRPSCLKRAG